MSIEAINWVLNEVPGIRPHLVSTLIGLCRPCNSRKGARV